MMNKLQQLLSEIKLGKATLIIRGNLYNQLSMKNETIYCFTSSDNSNHLETKIDWLEILYNRGDLYSEQMDKTETRSANVSLLPKTLRMKGSIYPKKQVDNSAIFENKARYQNSYGLSLDEAKELELLINEVRVFWFEFSFYDYISMEINLISLNNAEKQKYLSELNKKLIGVKFNLFVLTDLVCIFINIVKLFAHYLFFCKNML